MSRAFVFLSSLTFSCLFHFQTIDLIEINFTISVNKAQFFKCLERTTVFFKNNKTICAL